MGKVTSNILSFSTTTITTPTPPTILPPPLTTSKLRVHLSFGHSDGEQQRHHRRRDVVQGSDGRQLEPAALWKEEEEGSV